MRAVLGIDAAWTAREPSGVALVVGEPGSWHVAAAAPSYESFIALAGGATLDWSAKPRGGAPPLVSLLEAARRLSSAPLSVVAVDMPLANGPFDQRREADRAVSREFGARGCSTHSPSSQRPGPISEAFTRLLDEAGFPLATTERGARTTQSTLEVYPHPALLCLLDAEYRVPYKVARARRYWPNASVSERIVHLVNEFERIREGLSAHLTDLSVPIPPASQVLTLSFLKRFEDTLDALVCAWVATEYLAGRAVPFGDSFAAIWVPRSEVAAV